MRRTKINVPQHNTEMYYKKEYEDDNGQMRLLKRIPLFW